MFITQVTRFQSDKPEEVVAFAKQIKTIVEKHGAEFLRLSRFHDGPWIGEWLFETRCSSWDVFGKVQGACAKDATFVKLMAHASTFGKPTNRSILVEIDF